MTSRGNQSVSPPAQIPQQRHVNTISSSTPPPQQYYPAQSSALSQGTYEFLPQAQSQPYISYQAYGSALSDTRGQTGNSGRGVPSQQSLPQAGNFYQQPGPNIRPQQSHQNHAYFLNVQSQRNIRHSRPPHQSTSQQMFIPQIFRPQNNVITIPANMQYQSARVPMFQPNPFVQNTSYPTNIVYYPNGAPAWTNPALAPAATPAIRPLVREKKVLSIQDPDTGRDITEELLNSRSHAASNEEHHEDTTPVNQTDKDIVCQTFTRLVADRLKSPDDSSTSVTSAESHGAVSGAPVTSGTVIASQQYQQPPPPQAQQQQPAPVATASMMHPPPAMPLHIIPPRSGVIQQPPSSSTPSHDMQHQVLNVNLSMPPPQFPVRQSTQAGYSNVPQQQQQQQHPTHHASRHAQPPQQQQPIRQQMPPTIHPTSQQTEVQTQSHHQPPQTPPNLPSSTIVESALLTSVSDIQKTQVEATSQDNIPAKPTGPNTPTIEPATEPSSPVKEVSFTPSQTAEVGAIPSSKLSSMKTLADSEEINIVDKPDDSGRVEASHGESSQVAKDGRKGKKSKKDFIRKEIGGSDMDAFIDKVDDTNSGAGENSITRTNNALDITAESGSNHISVPQISSGYTATKNLEVNQETITNKDPPSTGLSAVSLSTGYSRDDSPILQKNQEQQKQPITTSAQVQHEAAEVIEKPPLPQSVTDRKSSLDKPTVQDIKTIPTSITVSQETSKVTKEPLPQLPPLVNTTPTLSTTTAYHLETKVEEKTVLAPQKEITTVESILTTDNSISVGSNTSTKSINQQPPEQIGANVRSNHHVPSQTERQDSKPLENGVSDDIHGEQVPILSRDTIVDLPRISHHVIIEGNVPSREPVPEQKDEDVKKVQSHVTSVTPTRPSSEKTVNKIKKDGKDTVLHYDRSYLMELRESALSQAKPKGLQNHEIILDRPIINTNRGTISAPLDFTPAFFQPGGGNQRHALQIGKTSSRNKSRTDVQIPQRVIKSVSLQDSVKPLHQSDKPWKPSPKQLSAGEIADKKKTLESEVLFIMNRLTPTNFERLAGEMRKLNIKSYEDLQELVKIFFDKVTMETKFVEAYANLCKVMSALRVQPPPNSGIKDGQATFRVVMLTKCQQEFEADKTVVFEDPEEKRKKIEAEMPEGPERTTQIENTLYQMKLKRLKFYGNIRFIGELFKLGMLTENIMHDCIYRLLKARDDDSLVSLCNLITTVGQALDIDKAKSRMDQYFVQMAKIAEERKSRIKFTLKDAIDLRNNNWIPRKEQTGPKKIDEVHKDFQEEQATKQFLQSQPLPPRSDTPQSNSRRGSRQRQDEKIIDDGWNTVGSKSLRIDASKMKLSKNIVDENSIQLGPGGGMKFSMWGRGSYGGAQPSQDSERPSAPANRYSALRGEEERRTFQRSPSRGESGVSNRNMRQGPTAGHGRGKVLTRSSQEGERRDALASARSIVGGRSQNSSRDNSWNREDHRQTISSRGSREGENAMTRSDISLRPSTDSLLPPSSVSPTTVSISPAGYDHDHVLKKMKPLTEEEMEHKAKTILDEYLSVRDLEEAKLCLTELGGQKHLHLLVTACINEVLEKSHKERELTGSFFHEIVKHGQLPMDIYIKGLAEVLQYGEDMVIDIPMMWTYLAQMIVPMLIGGSLSWSFLPAALKPYLGGRCSAKLIAEILLLAKEKIGKDDVALMWQSNNLDWTTFLPAEEVERFLKDKRLEFTVGPVTKTPSRVLGYSQVDYQKLTEDIEGIVQANGKSREICAYIDARVPVEKHDKHFIRALVSALVNASISTPAMKFSEEVLKTRKDVLQRCIKNDPELELQALYAIQALMLKLEHPSGVIAAIFDLLYDEEVISEEAFKQWENSTDPQELEGKGACSMQLTQFFAWLRENEEPETS